jgi:RNA polymerase-binding transcription factor DksA
MGTTKKVTPKPVVKKAATKEVAKKAPAKPVAKSKPAPKPAPKKAAAKPAAKPAPKALAKPVAKKVEVKPVAKASAKPVAKVAAKKVEPKAPVKANAKAAVKPAPKAPAKPAPKAAAKPAPKAPAKPAPKAAVKEAPKPVAKASSKPAPKAPVKEAPKPAAKAVAKPEVKKAPEKENKPAPSRPAKKGKSSKTTIVSTNSNAHMPKKSDVFKTNTFGVSNLKNESGKVIAHRKTSELKRKTNDQDDIKKYEPEATRSILEMNDMNAGPSYRYSDEDLQEFRELILRKLETAKAELQYLQGVIMRKDEGGTEDTENKYQNIEDGSASMEREQFNQLASRQITFIGHLEQALVRIENKTYGICRETGKLIDKARLRAVPHATLSIEAKNMKKN